MARRFIALFLLGFALAYALLSALWWNIEFAAEGNELLYFLESVKAYFAPKCFWAALAGLVTAAVPVLAGAAARRRMEND